MPEATLVKMFDIFLENGSTFSTNGAWGMTAYLF